MSKNDPARLWLTEDERSNLSTVLALLFVVAFGLLIAASWITDQAIAVKLSLNGAVCAVASVLLWLNRYSYDQHR